jgi:polysaccharide export outer membrane protein
VAVGAFLMLLAGCTSLEKPPELTDEEVFDTPDYVIAPLDTLKIFVWRSPELSTTSPVRPDGRISIPLVADLQAAGKTPSELSKDVEKALSPFVQNPTASVVVEKFADNSAQAVRVLGEVKQPTAVPYRPHITALDVVVAAGGLTEFANGNGARLIRRDAEGGGKSYHLNLDDLLTGGNLSENAKLRPGDLIVVPQSLL